MSQNSSEQQVDGALVSTEDNTAKDEKVKDETAGRNEFVVPNNQNAISSKHIFFVNNSELLTSGLFSLFFFKS